MELNCVGETCPIPVIKTKKALSEMESGVLTVIVDNIEAVENIEKMIKEMDLPYTTGEENGNFCLVITKGETDNIKETKSGDAPEKGNGSVVVVSSDKMGEGDGELGKTLLKTFIYTLTELDVLPDTMIFYNGGVKITTEGSSSLDDLSALQNAGVRILSCGACLNFYGLVDSLKVGSVSNMYEIATVMLTAERIVKP